MVYERILKRLCEKVRTRQYVMTVHAEEEMNDDNLFIFDVERAILTGVITERQRDRRRFCVNRQPILSTTVARDE